MASFQAAGTALRDLVRADDPVLHVLLDVRPPAHRRPGLGLRRRARPRLHDGRHRRPHHADRGGAPARRRALARARHRRSRTSSPTTRPSPTSSRSSCARASTGCTASAARTSSTTSRSTTRTGSSRPRPEGVEEGILRGLYGSARRRPAAGGSSCSPPARSSSRRCARSSSWPRSTTWLPTSGAPPRFQQLRNDALDVERWNRLHPDAEQRVPYVAPVPRLRHEGPIVAATDYLKAVPDMVARWIDRPVHRARHRWLRPLRHARGAAHPLRGQRRAHRLRRAPRPVPRRRPRRRTS